MHYPCDLVVLLLLLVGCSGSGMPARQTAAAQQNFDEGLAAFESHDYATAVEALTRALTGGGLMADLASQAYQMRAESYLELKEFDKALADLDTLEQAAEDLAELHELRGKVHLAQGNLDAAREDYQAARKLNPQIPWPSEIR